MFTKENSIELKKSSDWKEVVKKGVQILVRNKKATPKLADAILESTSKMGAYWVLEKGIALAHAPIGDYNISPGVSLVYLSDNIQFNGEDKYARIIITLSAIDSNSHMKYIQEFGKIFTNKEIKEALLSTSNLNDFLSVYKKKGGEYDN